MPRHCKIVATIGPASAHPDKLRELMLSGMNVARFNFSHGDHDFHRKNFENVRAISEELGLAVGILLDLQGPKIRCGKNVDDIAVPIEKDKSYTFKYGHDQKVGTELVIDSKQIFEDVQIGERILIDDGLILFSVTEKHDSHFVAKAINNGNVKSRKGVNFPDTDLQLPALTSKDRKDVLFAVKHRVDYVALSFVQRAKDVIELKQLLGNLGVDIPIISKIEKKSAVDMIDEIAFVSGGLMIARGDLGVECGVEKVPLMQRKIIDAADKYARPTIIATQMLESMIDYPRPTMAEINDVASGVLEGAGALMLSGEVASGKYPVKSVKRMVSIINEVERWDRTRDHFKSNETKDIEKYEIHEAIAKYAAHSSEQLGLDAIVCLSMTGSIAKEVSRWRPNCKIIAVSPRQDVIHKMALIWGVESFRNTDFIDTDELISTLPELLKKKGILKSGDKIILTAGVPMDAVCSTNMVKFYHIA